MDLNRHQRQAWQIAEDHGWHDEPRTVGDRIALMHSELSEALEEFRNHRGFEVYFQYENVNEKPRGLGIELADCLIRIFDFAQEEGLELEHLVETKTAYNRRRPYRHGGKTL
ncbi:MAG: hypothetical protein ACREQA_17210 [Candidatus Binatia bacterium]